MGDEADMTELVMGAGVIGGAIGAVILLAFVLILIKSFRHICPPSKVLIFSGRKHKMPDGSVLGYRVIRGGGGFRIPIIEKVSELDMRTFPVQVAVQNAFSRGGIPLTVQAIANVKISNKPKELNSAAERFLGMPVQRIAQVAQDTLEGALREVLAELTPEEVNEDRLKFADKLLNNAGDDFKRLGLHLDVLKIQHVSDEQGYLTNLGREAIANMLRDAENAENKANQLINQAKAAARAQAEGAQKQAEGQVLQKKNEYETTLATLDADARSVENESKVAAETARSLAEQELQEMRKQYEQLRLACDVVIPAEAKRRADELLAQGEAAPLVEDGKARAAALHVVAAEWAAAGAAGKEVYVLNHIREIAEAAVKRVSSASPASLEIVDGGDATSYGSLVAAYPTMVAKVMQETAGAIGVDLNGVIGSGKAGA